MENTNVFDDRFTEKTLVYLIKEGENGPEVLLGEHHKQQKLNAPGGKVRDINFEETNEEAAAREVFEETHLVVNPQDLRLAGRMTFVFEDSSIICHIYTVREWEGVLESTGELKNLSWYPIDNLPINNMWESDAKWIRYVFDRDYFEGRYDFVHEEFAIQSPLKFEPAGLEK